MCKVKICAKLYYVRGTTPPYIYYINIYIYIYIYIYSWAKDIIYKKVSMYFFS